MKIRVLGQHGKEQILTIGKGMFAYTPKAGELLFLANAGLLSFTQLENGALLITGEDGQNLIINNFFTSTASGEAAVSINIDGTNYTPSALLSSSAIDVKLASTSDLPTTDFQTITAADEISSQSELIDNSSTNIITSTVDTGSNSGAFIATMVALGSPAIVLFPSNQQNTQHEDDIVPAAGNILTGSINTDGSFSITAVNGEAANVGVPIVGAYGTLIVNSDGSYSYQVNNSLSDIQSLNVHQSVVETFNIQVTSSQGSSEVITLMMTIAGVNDTPIAQDEAAGSIASTATLSVNAAAGVLANDADVDANTTLQVSSVGHLTSSLGADIVMNADGSYSYDPSVSSTLLNIPLGQSLIDTFTYTITDNDGGVASASVSITVNGIQSLLVGTDAGDDLNGTSAADVIVGDPGGSDPPTVAGDTITGDNGNDIIFGDVPNTDWVNSDGSYGAAGTHDGAGIDVLIQQYNGIGGAYLHLVDPNNALLYDDANVGDNDTINAGNGDDLIFAQGGDDSITAGIGDDTIFGGNGSDTLLFSTANQGVTVNLITGTATGQGTDTFTSIENVVGSNNADQFISNSSDNVFDGGSGSDTVDYSNVSNAVTVNLTTSLAAGDGNDTLISVENVIGSDFNDTLIGGSGNNTLIGNDGNDTLSGEDVNDQLDGGSGVDTADYSSAGSAVIVNLETGSASGGGGNDSLVSIENVIGSDFNDTFTSSTDNNNFEGGLGQDLLNFAGVSAGIILDIQNGTATGQGVDVFNDIERFTGSTEEDTILASDASGNETINGNTGIDTIDYSNVTAALTVNLATSIASADDGSIGSDTLSNIENIIGGSGNNTFTGNNSSNVFTGNIGQDVLSFAGVSGASVTINLNAGTATGQGDDSFSNIESFRGSSGNDTVFASNSSINETIDGNTGSDTVDYSEISANLVVNLATGSITGDGIGADSLISIENVIGGNGNDVFISGSSNDNFIGGAGIDTVSFADIANKVTVNLAANSATGQGTDTFSDIESVIGSSSNDIFLASGSSTNDALNGNSGVDTVNYSGVTSNLIIDLNAGSATGADIGIDQISNIENVVGGSGENYFVSDINDNDFTGGVGIDTVSYVAATSGITATLANGSIAGGGGNDNIDNIESIIGSNYDDTFVGSRNDDNVDGSSGNDLLSFGGFATAVAVDILAGTATGQGTDVFSNIENFLGSTRADTFFASNASGNETIDGNSNTDTIDYSAMANAVTVDLFNGSAVGTGIGTDILLNIENAVGGSGNNVFVSNLSNNVFTGGSGVDTASYANATSGIVANLVAETVTGDGKDTLVSIESIIGSSNNDTFTGSHGNDTVNGGLGQDLLSFAGVAGASVVIDIAAGSATGQGVDAFSNIESFKGSTGSDTILASNSSGDEIIDGNTGTDTVNYSAETAAIIVDLSSGSATGGDIGTDSLISIENVITGHGDDTIISSNTNTNNVFDGGAGIDTLSFANANTNLNINLSTGISTGRGTDTITNIENIIGGTKKDVITGDNQDNVFWGGLGNDTLNGGAGNDTASYINGAAITATLASGSGSVIGQGTDILSNIERIIGSDNNDTFTGGNGDQTFVGGLGDDTLIGGAGLDTADYSSAANAITANLQTSSATGEGSDVLTTMDNLIGSDYGDTLIGSNSANTIMGGDGADLLDGNGGADLLSGGAGDDILKFDNALTSLHGGSGSDSLQFANGLSLNFATLSSSQYSGIEAIDLLTDTNANMITLDMNSVQNMSDTSNTLWVNGDSSDAVATTDTWADGGTTVSGSTTYHIYTSSSATLMVNADMNQSGILM